MGTRALLSCQSVMIFFEARCDISKIFQQPKSARQTCCFENPVCCVGQKSHLNLLSFRQLMAAWGLMTLHLGKYMVFWYEKRQRLIRTYL